MTNKHYISLSKIQKGALCAEVARRKPLGIDATGAAMTAWEKEHFPSNSSLDDWPSRKSFETVQVLRHLMAALQRKRAERLVCTTALSVSFMTGSATSQTSEKNQGRTNSWTDTKPTNKTFRSLRRFLCTNFEFLEGWLSNFKRRWGLKSNSSRSEAEDAIKGLIDEALPNLQTFL